MLDKAIRIATVAHEGQKDKAGAAYILHPLRVMMTLSDETERICAVLHDVIEDTDITIEDLWNEGFSKDILTTLEFLSKRENETYDSFIKRILNNKLACKVKLADLNDNMDLSRIPNPSPKDYKRVEKYNKAKEQIKKSLGKDWQTH